MGREEFDSKGTKMSNARSILKDGRVGEWCTCTSEKQRQKKEANENEKTSNEQIAN